MSPLADVALDTVVSNSLLGDGDFVLAMVSGGADSVSLLRLLASGALGERPIAVLHVDHMLRAAESEGDARFVADLCADLGVACRVVRYDVAAYAEAEGLNLEDAGRRVRYRFAEEELDARLDAAELPRESGRIATAHTLDDRIETLLMRIAAGAGAGGLVSPRYARGRVVRPLLDCSRAEVVAYLEELGQPWREDVTNADTSRRRARVRADVVPLLRDINPRLDEALARTVRVLADEDALLEEMAGAFARDFTQLRAGELRIERARMSTLSRPMMRRAIRSALFGAFPEASRIEFSHVEALCDAMDARSFARDLGSGLRAFTEYGRLVISREPEAAPSLAPSLLDIPGRVDLPGAGLISAEAAGVSELDGDPKSALIDADRIGGALTVDSMRPGDRMQPLGMAGSRKLQDVLTDAKIPRRRRRLVPVVRDGERIVWVAGVRMSEEYRVGPGTQRAVLLKMDDDRREGRGVIHPDIQEVLFSEERLATRIREMGEEVSRDYAGKSVLLVAVLRGAVLFIADLSRQISVPVEIDFMAVSSYGSSTKSSGVVRILKDLDEQIEGRHVLVVEDILDTGLTLKYLLKNLASRKPASLEVIALLSKEGKQRVPISCKYVGFSCPDEFVVGYGLDYAERYRNLPYIGVLKPAAYSE